MSKSVKHTQTQVVEQTEEKVKPDVGVVEESAGTVNEPVNEDPLAVDTPPPVEVKPTQEPPKPTVGFSITKKLNTDEPRHVPPASEEIHRIIKDKHDIDYDAEEPSSFIRTLMDDLDTYAKVMHPHVMVTDKQIETQQNILIRRINDALTSNPQTGVPYMLIIEEYFRHHITGAFGGALPFRGFNTIATRLQPYQDIVYTIQLIAERGKSGAMAEIDVSKLKHSCPTADAQVVLLAYLNV